MEPVYDIGILGGGQLGLMCLEAVQDDDLDFQIAVMDADPDSPSKELAAYFCNKSFKDYDSVLEFGRKCCVLTIEIEHVNIEALKVLKEEGVTVIPDPNLIEIVQDKGRQRDFYASCGFPQPEFRCVLSSSEIQSSELPIVQKTRIGGYDGKGVQVLNTQEDLALAFDCPSVLEQKVEIEKEIAVIVCGDVHGFYEVYDPVEVVYHDENLVDYLISPAGISLEVFEKAKKLALDVGKAFNLVGIMAVELFCLADGRLLINEVAPRPHNSGHHTIEATECSQYIQLLRILMGDSVADPGPTKPSIMFNLLADKTSKVGVPVFDGLEEIGKLPDVHVHLYGKKIAKPLRKMGHVTICGESKEERMKSLQIIKERVRIYA